MQVYIFDRISERRDVIKNILPSEGICSFQLFEQVYAKIPDCSDIRSYEELCKDCDIVEYQSISNYSIVFLHTSNNCSFGFMKSILSTIEIENNNFWLVCYSGGDETDAHAYNEIREKFPSYNKVAFFPYIEHGISEDELNQRWDIGSFIQAIKNNDSNPFKFLARKGRSHLIALFILCQGYLAAHGATDILEGWTEDLNILDKTNNELITDKKTTTEAIDYWIKGILDSAEGQTVILDELSALPKIKIDYNIITSLISDIYNSINGTLSESANVAEAYKGLKAILNG